jgi:hypothetical protein
VHGHVVDRHVLDRRPQERCDLAIDVVDRDVAGAGVRLRLLDRQRVHGAGARIAHEQHAVRPKGQGACRSHAGDRGRNGRFESVRSEGHYQRHGGASQRGHHHRRASEHAHAVLLRKDAESRTLRAASTSVNAAGTMRPREWDEPGAGTGRTTTVTVPLALRQERA